MPLFDTYGSTSLFTTVGDLLECEQKSADANGGPALIAEMTGTGVLDDGTRIGYRLRIDLEGERPREFEQRLEPSRPSARDLASYVGHFYYEEINTA